MKSLALKVLLPVILFSLFSFFGEKPVSASGECAAYATGLNSCAVDESKNLCSGGTVAIPGPAPICNCECKTTSSITCGHEKEDCCVPGYSCPYGTNLKCVAAKCVQGCNTSSDCPADMVCDGQNLCVAKGCTNNGDCASGHCDHNVCVNWTDSKKALNDPTCVTKDGVSGVDTAIGCFPIESQEALVSFFLKWAIGISGGIAFALILIAGFQIITSSGDPNRLKAGQELLSAAVTGLIMLIFSIFILKLIGVDILKLPGLG